MLKGDEGLVAWAKWVLATRESPRRLTVPGRQHLLRLDYNTLVALQHQHQLLLLANLVSISIPLKAQPNAMNAIRPSSLHSSQSVTTPSAYRASSRRFQCFFAFAAVFAFTIVF